LAAALGMHWHTLQYYLKRHNMYQQYSTIFNSDLDILVKTFKVYKPDSGLHYLVGFLSAHGIQVPQY
ncbi:hypothetical protein BD769DRAFT_1376155, partial [Suillus cothurnatus]